MDKFDVLSRIAPQGGWPSAALLSKHASLGNRFMPYVASDLAEDGFIPQEWAVFAWDQIKAAPSIHLNLNFTAFYRPSSIFDNPDLQERWSHCAKMASMTGRTSSEWLENPLATPAAVYGDVVAEGFVDRGEEIRALGEMARIRECGWAREQLAATARSVLGESPEDMPFWVMRTRSEVEQVTSRLIAYYGPVNEGDVRRQMEDAVLVEKRRRAVRIGEEDRFPETVD
ncbi:hypothetical protein [Azospirillum melinis]